MTTPWALFQDFIPFYIITLRERELLCLSPVQISPLLDFNADEQQNRLCVSSHGALNCKYIHFHKHSFWTNSFSLGALSHP